MPGDDFTKRVFVCKGRRFIDDASVVIAEIAEDGSLLTERWHDPKKLRLLHSGAVYEIEANATALRPTTARWLRRFEDDAQRKAWEIETQAADTVAESARMNKRDAERNELDEVLKPWRKVYQNTIGTSRRLAIELAVLNALRKPVRDK